MYALIYKGGCFLGIFSSKEKMHEFIKMIIKDDYEKNGYYGDFHFQYVKFAMNEPWFTPGGVDPSPESKAILSLYTMHPEKFVRKVKTNWSTGEILDMDAKTTSDINDK